MICKCCVTCVCCEIILLLSLLFLNIILEMPPAHSSVNMHHRHILHILYISQNDLLCIFCIFRIFCTYLSEKKNLKPGLGNHMRGTACYALPEKSRTNFYAVKRHNMSAATLQETAFHRSRGCKPE